MNRRRTRSPGPAPARGRRAAALTAAAAGLITSLVATAPANPAAAAARTAPAGSYQPCPAPQDLLKNTNWSGHRLAGGVLLREGVHDDRTASGAPGAVDMHVLRVNLGDSSVSTRPLVDHIAERQPLMTLAADRPQLVAATNTGFFDFYSGAPSGPVFAGGRPMTLSAARQPVLGFTLSGLPRPASVWLDGRVSVGRTVHQVQSVNFLHPRRGISIYTPLWGQITWVPQPAGRESVLREVRGGRVVGPAMQGHHNAFGDAQLLVASTSKTEAWLRGLRPGTRIKTTLRVRSTSTHPLVEGYNVGKRLVRNGKPAPNLNCRERDTQAARTGVGITANGKTLIVAVVADHPCYSSRVSGCTGRHVHGLDHKEMARLLIELGAHSAWQWDGSGSSELIARMPRSHRLEIRNYCADGEERPMPVGLGIFVRHRSRH